MKTYVIKQKQSGSGNIHDLASQHYDREIKFKKGTHYAVVLSSFYGGNHYTTHYTAVAAARQSNQTTESHHVIDENGLVYLVNGDYLESTDLCHTVY